MEKETMSAAEREYQNWEKGQQRSKLLTGILVITGGVLYMMRVMDVELPPHIFSWPVLLMCFGLITITKHNMKTIAGWALLIIGGIYFSRYFIHFYINTQLIFPFVIICIGFSILFKSKSSALCKKKIKKRFKEYDHFEDTEVDQEGHLNSSTFFGGTVKNIVSKDFKGANITSVFAGTEINLLRADFNESATLDLTCVFAGLVLIIPSHWIVQSEMVTIFGGMDDKRDFKSNYEGDQKILKLTGNCVFGGIEIKSFK
jgi:predicted membrane protein